MTDTAKTYGGALYDLALSEQLVDEILRDLRLVSAAFADNPGYDRLLANPALSKPERRQLIDEDFRNAILLAEKLGVDTIIGFSGCPGDSEGSKYPNWVTCPLSPL